MEKKFKVWRDEENGIIKGKFWGTQTEEDANAYTAELFKLIRGKSGKFAVLNDMTEAGIASSQARKIYAGLMKDKRFLKHAFWGVRTATRIVLSFIQKFAGADNIKYFSAEEEALKWLKEK